MPQVWMLSATQALCMSGSFLFVLLGGIIGSELAPAPGLATLPASLLIVGLAGSVLPSGALIRRLGRRTAFVASALLAACGCVVAGLAITLADFWMFCGAALLLGANNALVMQYRFAAVEYVEPENASKAIAIVMSGALAAAWLGPELAVRAGGIPGGGTRGARILRGHELHQQIRVQTLNDFMVFGAQAVASLLAGFALATIGWERLNLATLPLLAAVLWSVARAGQPRRASA